MAKEVCTDVDSKYITHLQCNQLEHFDNFLTLLGRGGLNQPALFSTVHFSKKKGVWRSQIS